MEKTITEELDGVEIGEDGDGQEVESEVQPEPAPKPKPPVDSSPISIKVNRKSFEAAIAQADSFADAKGTMPILANVLIQADDFTGDISIITTDLQLSFRALIGGEIYKEGAICLDCKNMTALLKASKAEYITIEGDGDEWAKISADGVEVRLPGLPADDFPSWPKAEGDILFQVEAPELISKLTSVGYAVAKDQTRYALNGALMEMEKGEVVLITTDGHRLAKNSMAVRVTMGLAGKDKESMILPGALIKKVRIWAKSAEPIYLAKRGAIVELSSDDKLIMARLLEGQFPNYKQPLGKDKDYPITCKVNTGHLVDALRQVAVLSDDKSKQVTLDIGEKAITIISSNADKGEIKMSIEAQSSAPTRIGINARYLIEAINAAPSATTTLRLKDATSSIKISNGQYEAILMPMRI